MSDDRRRGEATEVRVTVNLSRYTRLNKQVLSSILTRCVVEIVDDSLLPFIVLILFS